MTTPSEGNLLDQLADVDVPPLPENLDQHVHRRLNHWLLVVQIGDFLLGGLPFAFAAFVRAVGALVSLSLSGEFPTPNENQDQ